MTKLSKPVSRVAEEAMVRDAGKWRALAITIYPGGFLGLRPYGTRREETVSLASCYSLAVKQRVREEMNERKAKRRVVRKDR
jgi:hypothetical protein